MASEVERIFIGWDGSALDRAATWILQHRGEDLERVLVALPGARAARALREKLARLAKPSWSPPEILTQGALIDALVETDRPVAGRLARTLVWARALGELPRERLEIVAARPPEKGDLRGALALAETVRALHAELAEEGIGFEKLVEPPDARRYEVLAEAQARWRRILDDLGLADPHESRFAAIDAGKLAQGREVILVGIADMNRLLRHLAEKLGSRATALVFAPESEAGAFDGLGCVRTQAWKDRNLALPSERWHVVDGPDAQAERTIDVLASLDGRFAPEQITIGVCDEEVAPHLERRLAEECVIARHAAGTPVEGTRPFRLLAELAAWLPRRSFAACAELLRHPDLEAAIRRTSPDVDVAASVDAYHGEHLPARIDGAWLRGKESGIRAAHAALVEALGPLASDRRAALASWTDPIRSFLAAVFPDPLDPDVEADRIVAGSISALSDALGEIDRLPGALRETGVPAADAIELLLSMVRAEAVAPRAPAPGESVVELLGWLELPLDEAEVLVVTGFQEGFVPRSRRDDPFLPDGLRRRHGLPCAADRAARDLYASTVLLASKREIAFVSGRRKRSGDPLFPSRFLFHVPSGELLDRVEHASRREPASRRKTGSGGRDHAKPRLERAPVVESMRVTAFGDYLRSPYGFYLKHVLGVDTLDDSAREMDPRSFGSFAHAVLQGFGASEVRASTDATELERWLRARVEEIGRAWFGDRPLPTVALQLAQLARRLAFFARAQARRAAEGWRIVEVEWEPKRPVALEMGDGEAPMPLRGKIDRVEVLEAPGGKRAWAILDYKTSATAKHPDEVHRSRNGWRDLQLPLYTLLAAELGFEGAPALGYFNLGKSEEETRILPFTWSEALRDEALEAARDVVSRVRAGEFESLGRNYGKEPILLALAGQGLVAAAEDEGSEDGEDAAEGGA